MATEPAESTTPFRIICSNCAQELLVRPKWFGGEVQCPHCAVCLKVPSLAADAPPIAAPQVCPSPERRFSFACPRCRSLLETSTTIVGQTAGCPTCAARFIVPGLNLLTGTPLSVRLLDQDQQDPTPMHAYAASGAQAPHIRREADGSTRIECPRCGRFSPITADNCTNCGVPFTIDGVPTDAGRPGGGWAVAALVFGMIGVPALASRMVYVLAVCAVGCGLVSWLQRGAPRPSGVALAGMLLGAGVVLLAIVLELL